VVHFWASWANQCEPMDDAIKVMAEDEPGNISWAIFWGGIVARDKDFSATKWRTFWTMGLNHRIFYWFLELADVQFLRVEAEEKANISIEFQVAAVPTVLFFRGGKNKFWQILFNLFCFNFIVKILNSRPDSWPCRRSKACRCHPISSKVCCTKNPCFACSIS